jgi:hypothetical protein
VAQLEPVQLGASLGGLKASVQNDVGGRRSELAAAPPSVERPIGSPITKAEAPPPGAGVVPSGDDPLAVASAPKGADVQTPAAKPVPEAPPTIVPPTPQVSADAEGKMSDGDAARMQSQLARMSTRIQGVPSAGATPTVSLVGNANPQQMRTQHDELRESLTDARVKGAKDAATPLGEHALYPDVPEETLTATLPSGGAGGAGGGGPGAAGAAPAADGMAGLEADDAVAVIAREEKGAEVAGAVARASGGVSAAESRHTQSVEDTHTKNTTALAEAEAQNAAAQDAERKRAQSDVKAQRGEWSAAQSEEIRSADQEASEKIATTATDVETHRTEADSEAQKEIDTGNEKAEAAREEGERKAAAEKARANEESDGFFGWLASKAKAAFDAVKAGIKAALDFARKAIKAALDAAKKLATELIERARKWIVDKIKAAGDFLIALGDRVLANFPALRDKFRSAIQGLVAAAEDAINRLADGLKKAVTALLDAWGAALDAALGLLEAGLMAAIDIVAGAVQGAIKFAKGIAEALGTFAQLIADIASSPGAWISNLGAAIVDGLKNHLWAALKQAAQEWFNAKLEGILSVGKTIWAIVTGQLGFGEIAKMAWQAILALLPPVLAQILIEKLVAMIVPAAGAILAIVEGLRAAWGTVSRIIAAIDTFVAFLKAVKGGNAGPQFARALASAAIVVLDFVANFLLLKLGKGLMKLGGKLKGIAKRLMKKRKAAGAPKRPKKGKAKGDKRGEPKKDPKKEKPKDKDKEDKVRQRKERAERELPGKIDALLQKKPSRIRVALTLAAWRIQYRLSRLELEGGPTVFGFLAQINPRVNLGKKGWTFDDVELFRAIDEVAHEFIKEAEEERDAASAPTAATEQASPRVDLTKRSSQQTTRKRKLSGEKEENPEPVDLTQRRSPAAALVALKGAKAFRTGTIADGPDVGFEHSSRLRPYGPPWWKGIGGLGAQKGRRYPELITAFGDKPVGDWMAKLLRGEPLPKEAAPHAQDLGELHGLMFAKEPSHGGKRPHRRDLVYSFMTADLLAQGKPLDEIVGREGIHPAAFGEAQQGAKLVTQEMRGKLPEEMTDKERSAYKKRRAREVETIRAWFRSHKRDLPLLDRAPTLEDVKAFVRAKIRQFLQRKDQG